MSWTCGKKLSSAVNFVLFTKITLFSYSSKITGTVLYYAQVQTHMNTVFATPEQSFVNQLNSPNAFLKNLLMFHKDEILSLEEFKALLTVQ